MSVPLIDLHVKHIVDFTIRTVQANADQYICEIFGDAKLEPHAALYGDRYLAEVKHWITTTKIPVVLGFNLSAAEIPGVTVHLESSNPAQPFMGDAGFTFTKPLESYDRDVIVPTFSPLEVAPAADGSYIQITLDPAMDPTQAQLVSPGLRIIDKNGKEYGIGENNGQPTALSVGLAPLSAADLSEIKIVSPYMDAQFREGVMYYDDSVVICVHGHADRNEGLWLWAIVQWGLLKYRPILTATFGLDLAMPSASDFSKDNSFLGENVWTRYIKLSTKTVWSWTGAQSKDLVAFILSVRAGSQDPANTETVPL